MLGKSSFIMEVLGSIPGSRLPFAFATCALERPVFSNKGAVYQRLDSVIANHNVTGSNPV
jgi:Ni,Fe-hydrogenase III small subunit